jgi:hypothetical protein
MQQIMKYFSDSTFSFPELKQQIEAEQEGPERNTADFRIKKAQVRAHFIQLLCVPLFKSFFIS